MSHFSFGTFGGTEQHPALPLKPMPVVVPDVFQSVQAGFFTVLVCYATQSSDSTLTSACLLVGNDGRLVRLLGAGVNCWRIGFGFCHFLKSEH